MLFVAFEGSDEGGRALGVDHLLLAELVLYLLRDGVHKEVQADVEHE